MLDFDRKQRELLADKLFDAGNVAAGGMLATGVIIVLLDELSYRRRHRGTK